jgi:hypothetical protein
LLGVGIEGITLKVGDKKWLLLSCLTLLLNVYSMSIVIWLYWEIQVGGFREQLQHPAGGKLKTLAASSRLLLKAQSPT